MLATVKENREDYVASISWRTDARTEIHTNTHTHTCSPCTDMSAVSTPCSFNLSRHFWMLDVCRARIRPTTIQNQ